MEKSDSIKKLIEQFEKLEAKQSEINKELFNLKSELFQIKSGQEASSHVPEPISFPDTDHTVEKPKKTDVYISPPRSKSSNSFQVEIKDPSKKINLEKFVGENLISKIGIAVLVIGVAIGSKYAIDNIVFSPVLRIVAGYIVGALLFSTAYWLKSKYTGYSAVLLSGAMSIFYFVSFAAFSFYSFFSQEVCFFMMLIFTAYAVFAAIQYNQQIIAHIGLIGAYIIPFLVGGTSDNYPFLFSYIALVNLGILVIAIKKYWKSIYLSTFLATYIIYFGWFVLEYSKSDFKIGLFFICIFFLLFYATFLIYKLINKTKYGIWDILLIISNSFIFFGIGMALIDGMYKGGSYLGLFTLFNALLHLLVTGIVYRYKKNDKAFTYLTAGLVLVFITLVFPVQFDGSWVTLLWAGEALILFLIGRNLNIKEYELLSYPLLVLSFISQWHDWISMLDELGKNQVADHFAPFANIVFGTALILSLSYAIVFYFAQKRAYLFTEQKEDKLMKLFTWILPVILLITVYFTFEIEINNYWNLKYELSKVNLSTIAENNYPFTFNEDIKSFNKIWIINYSILFLGFSALLKLNVKTVKVLLGVGIGLLFISLSLSLYEISELRESYLNPQNPDIYSYSINHLFTRYYALLFIALLIFTLNRLFNSFEKDALIYKEILFAGSILWLLSSEWLHWLDIYNASNSYKLVLSIFWGVYAMGLVIYGLWKSKKHIRISAIVLLGATLVKMIFYDLTYLNTLRRAILFIVLGLIMLGISFLYNKYKHLISDDNSELNA